MPLFTATPQRDAILSSQSLIRVGLFMRDNITAGHGRKRAPDMSAISVEERTADATIDLPQVSRDVTAAETNEVP